MYFIKSNDFQIYNEEVQFGDYVLQNKTDASVIRIISYILILAGALTFLVSFLGYCGAMFESRCLLCVVSTAIANKSKWNVERVNYYRILLAVWNSHSTSTDSGVCSCGISLWTERRCKLIIYFIP